MEKKVSIAIFGAPINNGNLGCQALTYSLVSLLDKISKNNYLRFEYHIFEVFPCNEKKIEFCNKIQLDEDAVKLHKLTRLYHPLSYIKHPVNNIKSIIMLKKCVVAIDLTEGDSFSDIYGQERFNNNVRNKMFVIKMGVPYILGPQTYGPFEYANYSIVKKIVMSSLGIITRDSASKNCISKITGKKIQCTTDLAFQLPYNNYAISGENKKEINIGINISGLLINEKTEDGFNTNNKLLTNYDEFIYGVLEYLNNKRFRIYLISHVKEDYFACEKYHNLFPNTILVDEFSDPITAKSFISAMDLFIGSRMHATIAAFSSGVPTIPIAYSRKFDTMFKVVGYKRTIDITILNTEKALKTTISYIEQREDMKKEVQDSLCLKEMYGNRTYTFFENLILEQLMEGE